MTDEEHAAMLMALSLKQAAATSAASRGVDRASSLIYGRVLPLVKTAVTTKQMIATERRKVNEPVSPEQADAGNYRKGHIRLHGLDISIENAKGSTRSGTSPDGKTWSNTMEHDYGYIRTTDGADGDSVDVFVGGSPDTELFFVVNQNDPATGRWDEHKVLCGFNTQEEAEEGYLANYEKGWKGMGAVVALTVPQFKWWLAHGDTKKPIKDGLFAKKSGAVADDDDFWNSPPNKEGRTCPGCGELFKEVEPLAGVDMCEACERFGPPKEKQAVARKTRTRVEEYDVCEHCNEEIGEKSLYYDGKSWFHRPCRDKGPIKMAAADEEHKKTVAVDLDGTILTYDGWKGEDHFGKPRPGVRKALETVQSRGHLVIINTCRGNTSAVKKVLKEHDIPFDHVNENPQQPEGTSDKIQADVYVDDRAIDARSAWSKLGPAIEKRLKTSATAWVGKPTILAQLQEAKASSDAGNYRKKHQIMRRLMSEYPDQFTVDSTLGNVSGVTHGPSGFQLHLPAKVASDSFYINALKTTPVVPQLDQGLFKNITSHLGKVQSRGHQAITEKMTQDNLQNAIDPNRSRRQFLSYLSGQRKPIVNHWLDRVLEGDVASV